MEAWLADVQQAGLEPPTLAAGRGLRPEKPQPGAATLPRIPFTHRSLVDTERSAGGNGTGSVDKDAARSLSAAITNQTRNHTFAFPDRWCMQMDKVLYINLNRIGQYAMLEQARLLHAVYRPFFRQVVFAGFGKRDRESVGTPGIFYPCDPYLVQRRMTQGFYAQTCLAGFLASDTWQSLTQGDTVGLLYINDDVVFDPCAVAHLDASKVWYGDSDTPNWRNKTLLVSNATGWHWGMKFGPNTLKNSTAHALNMAYGLLSQRVQQRLKHGTHMFTQGQADAFYVPGHLYRMFSDFAHQLHAQYLISEVAVPNILGLIHDEDDGFEEVLVVMAWTREDCAAVVKTILEKLPANDMLSCKLLQMQVTKARGACTGKSMFALHAYKMSDTAAAVHWLAWWLAQDCY
jgi:hypothetical protein